MKVRHDQNPEAEPLHITNDEEFDHPKKPTFRRHHSLLAVAYVLLIPLYAIAWVKLSKSHKDFDAVEVEVFPSIAKSSAFRTQQRVFPLTVAGTPFAGDPSPDLDEAWHELLKDTTIRVSKEDLDYYNILSLPLADGSGYASELFMSHELHCLKKIRQWIYKETYFEHVQGFERNELKRHIDHCIETLRQGIMCRGDISLGTYTYLGESRNVTVRNWATHQCIDFGKLMGWARERAVNIFDDSVLANPENLGSEHFTAKKKPH